ncbi:hypothetical protein MVEN_01962900 [Mycena venus]|uniref:Uncharacterized protein n=1 Tax=Mycena venus TaxID=2733690 RepID=A0A8H6XFC9_9AGAR|nr:hypothetical protein MVEN_01962800 [Mycena venus]KAF7340428.1 hypothetical protein MVEN_01962900 [Mycena venus]
MAQQSRSGLSETCLFLPPSTSRRILHVKWQGQRNCRIGRRNDASIAFTRAYEAAVAGGGTVPARLDVDSPLKPFSPLPRYLVAYIAQKTYEKAGRGGKEGEGACR